MRVFVTVIAMWAATGGTACYGDVPWPADTAPTDDGAVTTTLMIEPIEVEVAPPPSPVLVRLTDAQYRATVRALFGADVALPPSLEPDLSVHGLLAIGAGVASASPRGVELYFDAARSIAAQLVATDEGRAAIADCDPGLTVDDACLGGVVTSWGRRIWRRPLTEEESARVLKVAAGAAETLDDAWAGVEYALATLLQSPHFLYRVELGEDDPGDPGLRRHTSLEMAPRLSYFLWNSTPDDTLLDVAEQGLLVTDEGVSAQVERMLTDPRARDAVKAFFSQWLRLELLDDLQKDPNVFKHFDPDLGAMAREETLRLVEHMVFEEEADYRDLFRTRTTFVNRRLAAIYNIPAPVDDGFGMTVLPASGQRRGLLGHVSFLALHSHPVASSPTLRGLFIREHMLCDEIPSPPSNLNTAIPEPDETAQTMRERLLVHMQEPSCSGCHEVLDPPGFGLESFDGIGRFRVLDNGGVIDASGWIDDLEYDDAAGLTEVLATHPRLVSCFVETMYGYATGHTAGDGEVELMDALADRFAAEGHRVLSLMAAIAVSPGFRLLGEIDSGDEAEEGSP